MSRPHFPSVVESGPNRGVSQLKVVTNSVDLGKTSFLARSEGENVVPFSRDGLAL